MAYVKLQLKPESDYQSVKARLEELFDEDKVNLTYVKLWQFRLAVSIVTLGGIL